MGQAIYFSPLNPWRLGVLSEAGVRTKTDRKLLFDEEGKRRMRSHAKTRRRKGGRELGGMFQFHPVGFGSWPPEGEKLWGRLFISLP